MINAVRTLLMNRSRAGYAHDFPGEEFIEPNFRPRRLPPYLLRAHQTLFGREPDRFFLNFRVRQLLTIIHSTELDEYVRAFDPRLTYLPLTDELLFEDAYAPDAVQIGHTHPLYVSGTFTADEGLGLAQQVWSVVVGEPGTVTITRQRPRAVDFVISYASSGGLSPAIALPGSGLHTRFHSVAPGTTWRIEATGRPESDIGQILGRLETALGDGGVSQIFGPAPTGTMGTYWRIWSQHPYFVNRFAALLLAIATQIAAAPQEV